MNFVELRHIIGFVISFIIYYYYDYRYLATFLFAISFPILRRFALKTVSVLLYSTGISIQYISIWNASFQNILINRRFTKYNVSFCIGSIKIQSFYPLEIIASDICLDIILDNRKIVKENTDQEEKLVKEEKNVTSFIMVILKFARLILSYSKIRIMNLHITYSKFGCLQDISIDISEFFFHPIDSPDSPTIPLQISMEDFHLYTRETIFSQEEPDLVIPIVNLIIEISRDNDNSMIEKLIFQLNNGFHFNFTASFIRYMLSLKDEKSRIMKKNKSKFKLSFLQNTYDFSNFYKKYQNFLPSSLEIEIGKSDINLSINKELVQIQFQTQLTYSISYDNRQPVLLHIYFSIPFLYVGRFLMIEKFSIQAETQLTNPLKLQILSYRDFINENTEQIYILFQLNEFHMNFAPEYLLVELNSLLNYNKVVFDPISRVKTKLLTIQSFSNNKSPNLTYSSPSARKPERLIKKPEFIEELMQLFYALKISLRFEIKSVEVNLSPSLISPIVSIFSIQKTLFLISHPIVSFTENYIVDLQLYSISWDGSIISNCIPSRNKSLAKDKFIIIPEVLLKLGLPIDFSVIYMELNIPQFNSNLSSTFLETFCIFLSVKNLISENKVKAEVVERKTEIKKKIKYSVIVDIKNVDISYYGLSSQSDGISIHCPSISMYNYTVGNVKSLFILNNLYISSFLSPNRNILSLKSFLLKICPSENKKLFDVCIVSDSLIFNFSFGLVHELLNQYKLHKNTYSYVIKKFKESVSTPESSNIKNLKNKFRVNIAQKKDHKTEKLKTANNLPTLTFLPKLTKPKRYNFLFTLTRISIGVDLSPYTWCYNIDRWIIKVNNTGQSAGRIENISWRISDQTELFMKIKSINFCITNRRNIEIKINLWKMLTTEKSRFGDQIGAGLVQFKIVKTLYREHVAGITHYGDDKELLESLPSLLLDKITEYNIKITANKFHLKLLGDSMCFSYPVATDNIANIQLFNAQIEIQYKLSDHCRAKLIEKTLSLDESSYNPIEIGYDVILGFSLKDFSSQCISVYLGDFPLPLFECNDLKCCGFVSISILDSVEKSLVFIPYRLTSFKFFKELTQIVERGGDNSKLYCDLKITASTVQLSYSIFMSEIFNVFGDMMGFLTPTSLEGKTPKLMWWDKLRYMIHGNYELEVKEKLIVSVFLGNVYEEDKIRLFINHFKLVYDKPSTFDFCGTGLSAYLIGIENLNIPFFQSELFNGTAKLGWISRDNPNDHHIFQHHSYSDNDIYFYYRSLQLVIDTSINFEEPDYSCQVYPNLLQFAWKDEITTIYKYIKMLNNTFSRRSMTLGVLLMEVKLSLFFKKPRFITWFETNDSRNNIIDGNEATIRIKMNKILFGTEQNPQPNLKSVWIFSSIKLKATNLTANVYENQFTNSPWECPDLSQESKLKLLAKIDSVELTTGLDESSFSYVMNKNIFQLGIDKMDPCQTVFVKIDGLKLIYTFLTKRFLFSFKDQVITLLFPPPYDAAKSSVNLLQRSPSFKGGLVYQGQIQKSYLSDSNYLLEQLLMQTKGDPNYKFYETDFNSVVVSNSRYKLGFVLVADNFQSVFMTPDSPLNTIFSGKQLYLISTNKTGKVNQDISKIEILFSQTSSFILAQTSPQKIEWITPKLLDQIQQSGQNDMYFISPQWLKETDLRIVYNYNPFPPGSINMLDPAIQSDELSKISIFIPRLEISGTSTTVYQIIELIQNIVIFSFYTGDYSPPVRKSGVSKLPHEKLKDLQKLLESYLEKQMEDDSSIISIMEVKSTNGYLKLVNEGGVNFGTLTFNDFKFLRYSHQDGSVLNTITLHQFNFNVNPPISKTIQDRDTIVPSVAIVPDDDNMINIRMEMGSATEIEGWPIKIYNSIEISIFPCSSTYLKLFLISNLLQCIQEFVFPQTKKESQTQQEPQELCRHEFERYFYESTEELCTYCKRVVQYMTRVQFRCKKCGELSHAYCKETAENTEQDGDLIFCNSLRIGDLRLLVSISGFRVNLKEWSTILEMKSYTKQFNLWSGITNKLISEYTSELLRKLPRIILDRVNRKQLSTISLDKVSERITFLQLSKEEQDRQKAEREKDQEKEKWSYIFDPDDNIVDE